MPWHRRNFLRRIVCSIWALSYAGLILLNLGVSRVNAEPDTGLQASDFVLSNENNAWPILYSIKGRYSEGGATRRLKIQIDGGSLRVNPRSKVAPFRIERLQFGICRMVSKRQGHWDLFLLSADKWDWYPHPTDDQNSVVLDFIPEIGVNYPLQPAIIELPLPDDFDLKGSWLCSIIWNTDHSGYLPAHTGYYFSAVPRTE